MIMNPTSIKHVVVDGHSLTLESFVAIARYNATVELAPSALEAMQKSRALAEKIAAEGRVAYGITTGFGEFQKVAVPKEMSNQLSTNLILSHCTAAGEPYADEIVRGMMLLRANALCGGVSGVRPLLVEMLLEMLNKGVTPVVPQKGSLGSSGDLAPLAHMTLPMLGKGEAMYEGVKMTGAEAMAKAGIATQIKVEEELRVKEGLTRYDLGREKFLQRVWKWKEEYGNRIVEQQKKMGVSCDWSRSRFTMDEGCSKAVRETFCELYDKGLIYKGSRIINWCPHCITALSDAEVEYVDKPGHLWYIRYPLADGSGDIVVATTRPETMMGDTGVAVNPEDERFRDLVGKTCILPIMNREIPIVADDYVELGFGTGAVKMTPAHDPNDFEVGLRHNLEVIRCIGDDGKINENGGPYNGMDRYECRKQIVKDLEEQGYLVKTEPYNHNVGTCYRCHNDVEPLISAQWFVKMEPLAKEALRVVNEGEVKFVPERFSKTYIN